MAYRHYFNASIRLLEDATLALTENPNDPNQKITSLVAIIGLFANVDPRITVAVMAGCRTMNIAMSGAPLRGAAIHANPMGTFSHITGSTSGTISTATGTISDSLASRLSHAETQEEDEYIRPNQCK